MMRLSRTHRSGFLYLLIGLVACAALVLFNAIPGSATTPTQRSRTTPGNHTASVQKRQAPIVRSAYRIYRSVKKKDLSRFVGYRANVDERTLNIYWHGSRNPELDRAIKAADPGVKVHLINVPYDADELRAEETRISRLPAHDTGAQVLEVAYLPDFDGLKVTLKRPSTDQSTKDAPVISSSVHVVTAYGQSAHTERASLQQTPRPRERTSQAAALCARWLDCEPYAGGAAIIGGGSQCTTTAAVRKNGQEALLTAGHCGANVEWSDPTFGVHVGTSGEANSYADAMLLTGEQYQAYVYGGPWDSSQYWPISGTIAVGVGTYVCTSGAVSGESCDQKVTDVGVMDENGVGPGFNTQETTGTGTVGHGDSGGPVYYSDATAGFLMTGMIDAIYLDSTAPCVGKPDETDRGCASRSFHVDIDTISSHLGISVDTA